MRFVVGERAVYFDAAVHRPRVHHLRARFGKAQRFMRQAELLEIALRQRSPVALHALELHAKAHDDVGAREARPQGVKALDRGEQRGLRHQMFRADEANIRPKAQEQLRIGRRDAAVLDVAADGDRQPLYPSESGAYRRRVEQRLRRVFAHAVAGVNDRAGDAARELVMDSRLLVARDDDMRAHRGERLNVDGEVAAPRAVLEKGETPLAAQLRSAPLNADFDGVFNAATGALNGRIEANGDSVRRLLGWFGSPMAEGGGFGTFNVTGQMNRAGETTELTEVELRLDEINAAGALTLINQAGIEPDALQPADVDEIPYKGELPRACATRLARAKAEAALDAVRLNEELRGAYIIAADTVVAVGRRILPKVEDEATLNEALKGVLLQMGVQP